MSAQPRRYRRRVPEVDAIQFTGGNVADIADWCGGHLVIRPGKSPDNDGSISVGHSMVPVRPGDFVVRDRHSDEPPRFYPMRESVFLATYELIEEV